MLAGKALELLKTHKYVFTNPALHLSVSLRSFRAEYVSLLIKNLLDLNIEEAQKNYAAIKDKYPIVLTRSVSLAKNGLKKKQEVPNVMGLSFHPKHKD